MEYRLYHLKNGLRILHKNNPHSQMIHACVVINCGSRDEEKGKEGLAHFIEHMIFKGTKKRSMYHILNRMEVVGGELNAYTTKEQTCIHASFLQEHTPRALELFSDILFNSVFPEAEIKKEKQVVMDEMDSYLDLPEEAILDEFESVIFKGHALGENILGTKESVKNIKRKDLINFTNANYLAGDMVIGIFGNIDESKILRYAEQYFSFVPSGSSISKRKKPGTYKPEKREIKKNCIQSHAVLGNRACSVNNISKTPMMLLSNYLGGPGMSSRLNMEIREKKGICYTIDAGYTPLVDSGAFNIYMGTDPGKMDKCISLVQKELKFLRDKKLSNLALHQAKKKIIGQISLAEENHLSVIMAICKSVLDHGKADSLESIYKKINAVTAEQLLELSNIVFAPEKLSSVIYIPE